MFLTCCDRFVNTSIFFFTEKSITCEENFPHNSIKEPFGKKTLPYQHTDLINAIRKKLRKTFCFYNCLDLKYIDNFKNPYLVKSQISQVILFLFCGEKLIFLGTTLVCYIFEISYGTNFVCLSDLVLLLQGKEFELFAFDKIWDL